MIVIDAKTNGSLIGSLAFDVDTRNISLVKKCIVEPQWMMLRRIDSVVRSQLGECSNLYRPIDATEAMLAKSIP